MRIQSENNSLDSSKLAQLFENWSPFPSPRGLDSKYEKFPPPKVLGRTSAVPGRHKSEPLNLETEVYSLSLSLSFNTFTLLSSDSTRKYFSLPG